jgi:putative RNA 2'-phosphotransferase
MTRPPTLTETSKFLSFVLRHQPEAIGLALDREGWASVDALIQAAQAQRPGLNRALIDQVVATSDKQRFELSADGSRIRAAQGHSSASVAIGYAALTPPDRLYHGTATRFWPAIQTQGLRAGQRQYVHLSTDPATATQVGARYGQPLLLTVDAAAMHARGHVFHQASNGVWLTAAVPPEFVALGAAQG